MLPTTADRVSDNTAPAVNERIRRRTDENVARYAAAGPDAIEKRLDELDREWDIERTIEANAATLSLAGVVLGAFVHRGFLILPGVVTGFLLQHALQGWCPPVPIFRRMGRRTQSEIAEERYALKALRGDFDGLGSSTGLPDDAARKALRAARA